jgi:uncharacterized protein (DUF58 family)
MAITGRAVILAAFGVILAMLVPEPATVLIWSAVVLLMCLVDVALAASPRRVALARTTPGSVRLSETSTTTLTVRNDNNKRLRAIVRDAWVPSAGAVNDRHVVNLPAGESRRLTTTLIPTRRGDRAADLVTVRSLGPLGLAARQASLACPAHLRVLPEFASRRHLPSRLARLREMDGRTAVQVRGAGTEFDSLREYTIGDDVRSIDWRATARRADVVVRTWRPERDRRVLVVIDTSRTSAARIGDLPRLDAAIEAALLLTALTTKAGDRVDLVAMDRTAQAQVSGITGPRLLPTVADALAVVEPKLVEADWPRIVSEVMRRVTQRSLVVLLTALEPAAAESGLLDAIVPLAAKHTVVVASVRDEELAELASRRGSVADVFDAAAAERTMLERLAVIELVRLAGADVVDELPESLAPALADRYLALKAAGKL